MPIYLGNQKIKTLYVGGQKIKEAWTMVGGVLTKVYSAIPPFTASGMTKNGSWVPTANGAWIVVPAWTADSGSTVSSNGVQARGAKANAVVSGQLSIAAAVGAYQVSVRLKVDGVVVKIINDYPLAGYATTNVPIASDPRAVAAGQVVTIECWFANYASSFTTQSGANTYVRIT
ncbi:hypothetical protein KKP62_10105 [Rhodococcus sp. GOMB7]|uniref:hypothetical protein n=1 Tax=Rhodococcus sp. GOMB7 TaxID=2839033 RepID=UPI001BFFF4BE|nr:hypothetical protein [Rhodococcus sp. GOMB7]MBT9295316.1 hypothetical protein [Rhodococcus sp. GOMB7]